MKKKEKPLKIYSFEDVKDKFLGKIGTPKRDRYEKKLKNKLKKDKNFNNSNYQNDNQEDFGYFGYHIDY